MNRKKLNIRAWCALALAAVLVTFSLVAATGMTWARYRTDSSADISYNARSPMMVSLGKVEFKRNTDGEEEAQFVPSNAGEWTRREDGQLQLDFAVANGTSAKEKEFETRDQQVCVRVTGTLGLQIDEETIALKLKVPKQEDPEEEPLEEETETPDEGLTEESDEDLENFDVYEAQAVYISKGSPMYTTFGEGWVFRFMIEEDEAVKEDGKREELCFLLEGGELNYIQMHLTMESSTPVDTSLLQLQIDSRYVTD